MQKVATVEGLIDLMVAQTEMMVARIEVMSIMIVDRANAQQGG